VLPDSHGRSTAPINPFFRTLGRDDGEVGVVSSGNVGLLHEAEDFGVEPERVGLIVDENAGEFDLRG